jgi:hypothetical protein
VAHEATSGHGSPPAMMTVGHGARCTIPGATAPRSARRSRSSWFREDEEHTAFIAVDGIFCYVSMPYALKNVLPTFVRAMHKTFRDLIRDLVEVYVDDIIVKIKLHSSLPDNLAIVFDRLCSTCTMLNPDKCLFKVSTGKLLGFLVSHRGIEANQRRLMQFK